MQFPIDRKISSILGIDKHPVTVTLFTSLRSVTALKVPSFLIANVRLHAKVNNFLELFLNQAVP